MGSMENIIVDMCIIHHLQIACVMPDRNSVLFDGSDVELVNIWRFLSDTVDQPKIYSLLRTPTCHHIKIRIDVSAFVFDV